MKYQIRGINIGPNTHGKFIKKYMEWYNTCRHLKGMTGPLFSKATRKKQVTEILKLITIDAVYKYDTEKGNLLKYSVDFERIKGCSTNYQSCNQKTDDIVLNERFSLFHSNFYNEYYEEVVHHIPINHKKIKVRQEKFFDVLVPKINIIFEFENNNLKNVELETKEDINNELMKEDLLKIISLLS
tara:strand:- start:3463 stop:4017 length:555 start_codon:yes stop_codon:yes gene_type:complete